MQESENKEMHTDSQSILRTGLLTVIIPAYNEAETIPAAASVISRTLEEAGIPYECIFVDDGSKDAGWQEIEKLCREHSHIRGISFSRNFGKESAIYAGLAGAAGDCCAVIDCDLQHPPAKLVDMYRLWQQGYEVIEGVKKSRGKENSGHTFAANCFYGIISSATGIDMSRASDFRLLDKRAVKALLSMPERNVFFRALSSWVGFRSAVVEFDVQERTAGKSKWSGFSLFKYAIRDITSFTTAPMQVVTILGIVMFLVSVILAVNALVDKIRGYALADFTTMIILQCFIGSVIMVSLGIIGYYIARIYEEVKCRPKYIIEKEAGSVTSPDAGRESRSAS